MPVDKHGGKRCCVSGLQSSRGRQQGETTPGVFLQGFFLCTRGCSILAPKILVENITIIMNATSPAFNGSHEEWHFDVLLLVQLIFGAWGFSTNCLMMDGLI